MTRACWAPKPRLLSIASGSPGLLGEQGCVLPSPEEGSYLCRSQERPRGMGQFWDRARRNLCRAGLGPVSSREGCGCQLYGSQGRGPPPELGPALWALPIVRAFQRPLQA